jgi:hypothetical protein
MAIAPTSLNDRMTRVPLQNVAKGIQSRQLGGMLLIACDNKAVVVLTYHFFMDC